MSELETLQKEIKKLQEENKKLKYALEPIEYIWNRYNNKFNLVIEHPPWPSLKECIDRLKNIDIDCILQTLKNLKFIDIEFSSKGINATLPAKSNIRSFQKETIRYFGITAITPTTSIRDINTEPIDITCEREEKI